MTDVYFSYPHHSIAWRLNKYVKVGNIKSTGFATVGNLYNASTEFSLHAHLFPFRPELYILFSNPPQFQPDLYFSLCRKYMLSRFLLVLTRMQKLVNGYGRKILENIGTKLYMPTCLCFSLYFSMQDFFLYVMKFHSSLQKQSLTK